MKENRITVRLTDELHDKIQSLAAKSRSKGLKMSDIVRQAIVLLPDSPDEISQTQHSSLKIRSLQKVKVNIQMKDETEALKSLQNW